MTAFTSSVSGGRAARGFSLVELAVVMLVMGLLLGGIVVPLRVQIESRNYEQTQRILDQAREALIGYAAANGRFPCPASAANNPTIPNGAEHFFSPGGTAANGICHTSVTFANAYIGFLPAATLGFTPVDASGYAVDAWGSTQNRIRYAVSSVTVNTITLPFTKTSGMRLAGMSSIASPTLTTLLYVCNSGAGGAAMTAGTNCGTAVALASNAPIVIWSVGPNAATGGTSVDEKQNPNPTAGFSPDRIFVSRIKAAAGEVGGEFDDIVTWIGAPTLFSRLIAAGQLP